MRHVVRSLLSALLVTITQSVLAQPPSTIHAAQPPADALQRANALFVQSDWNGALDAYSALSKQYPNHGLSRFRVGVSLVGLGKFAEGEAALREGERLGIPAANAGYRLAQALAEQHKPDAAIAELMRSAAAGAPVAPSAIVSDPHFASLISHTKWQAVLDAFDAVVRPCMHDARHRAFDFWVGDWDVRATGAPAVGPAARNTVTIDDNGCVVTEHWIAPGGSEGQSFNIFDRSIGQWRQTWVDNTGGQHDYRGAIKDGNMVYAGDTPAPGGQLGRTPTRLTFFHVSADSVRQFSQTSSDSGKTWTTAYDLMYVRRSGEQAQRPTSVPISDADRAAILAVDSAFVDGWLRNDTTKVLGLFAADAVLMPPGAKPVTGLDAIRAYWWPSDGSHTRITSFTHTIAEVGGGGGFAFVRGTGTAGSTYTGKGERAVARSTRSADLILYSRDAAGHWRVTRQMWSTLP
jgi:ketosteroid isomerase-like protein